MELAGVAYTSIVSGQLGNKNAESCAGVPGQNLPSASVYANFGMKLAVAEDMQTCYATASGGYCEQTNLSSIGNNDGWWAYIMVNPYSWKQEFWSDFWWAEAQENCIQSAQFLAPGVIGTSVTGHCDWPAKGDPTTTEEASSMGYKKLPFNFSEMQLTETTEEGVKRTRATAHVMVPILYGSAPTDRVALSSKPFYVDVTEILAYFLGGIRKSGKFVPTDRAGGGSWLRKGGSWRECKNVPTVSANNTGFLKKGAAWDYVRRFQ